MNRIIFVFVLGIVLFACASQVSAHVSLSPKEAVVGYTTFTVNVPTEKEIPTTEIRVVVPDGVEVHGVAPVAGWIHSEKKAETEVGRGDDHKAGELAHGKVTEIVWTGGKIADGEFMQFPISISYAGDPKQLVWKAYQKYADGSVVAWDDTSEKNPAPKVSIVATSKVDQVVADIAAVKKSSVAQTPWLSMGAFLISVAALAISVKKKK